jgi:hypothetical protein
MLLLLLSMVSYLLPTFPLWQPFLVVVLSFPGVIYYYELNVRSVGGSLLANTKVVSVPSDPSTLRPVYHLRVTSPSNCLYADPLSNLLLTEVSLGNPVTEIQINCPY